MAAYVAVDESVLSCEDCGALPVRGWRHILYAQCSLYICVRQPFCAITFGQKSVGFQCIGFSAPGLPIRRDRCRVRVGYSLFTR